LSSGEIDNLLRGKIVMITIGAYFGEAGQQDSAIGLIIRSAMNAVAGIRGDWTEGFTPAVNVVFYVPGSVSQYGDLTRIKAGRFSRKQKLLLVAVPVPASVVNSGKAIEFVVDALYQANRIAADVLAKKGVGPFVREKADAIVEKVKEAIARQPR
jgi:hypothetical protein